MPRLPSLLSELVAAGPLPLDDDAAESLQELSRTALRRIAERAGDLLGPGVGHALLDLGVPRAAFAPPVTADALAAHPAIAPIARGERSLVAGDDAPDAIAMVQRALQAVAARVVGAPRQLALVRWGADGTFGDELVRAVVSLQAWRDLRGEPGVVGTAEIAELIALLRDTVTPDPFAPRPAAPPAIGRGARRVVDIARAICDATRDHPFAIRIDGRRYVYWAELFGIDPESRGLLRAPGGVGYQLGRVFWKCNVFGGVVLSLAELPVPTHRAGRYRHFPRAERFGDRLAAKAGWQLVRHLDHRDPDDPERPLVDPEHDAEIRELLGLVVPGDLLFVDHPGPPGEDGGHTRVCVAATRPDDPDVAPEFAQAREDRARVLRDGMTRLGGGAEIQLWLLRYTG